MWELFRLVYITALLPTEGGLGDFAKSLIL